ncbi:MAG: thioredoxin family protein [Thiothrix sp.]
MLRKILLTMLVSLSISIPTVLAEEKPADADAAAASASNADKPTANKSTEVTAPDKAEENKTETTTDTADSGKVEVRDVSQFFDDSFGNMQDEIATAKEDGKEALLVMFEMDECPFCHRMKTTVLNRSDIQDYFKDHFRIISVDIEGDLEMTDFKGESISQKDFALKEFRVRATPVFQFIGLDGTPIKNGRLTGATKDAGEFMLFGQYIVGKKYEETPFSKFKREQGAALKADDAKS